MDVRPRPSEDAAACVHSQAFGLRHGGPPAPTRRSTRPPVWRCAGAGGPLWRNALHAEISERLLRRPPG